MSAIDALNSQITMNKKNIKHSNLWMNFCVYLFNKLFGQHADSTTVEKLIKNGNKQFVDNVDAVIDELLSDETFSKRLKANNIDGLNRDIIVNALQSISMLKQTQKQHYLMLKSDFNYKKMLLKKNYSSIYEERKKKIFIRIIHFYDSLKKFQKLLQKNDKVIKHINVLINDYNRFFKLNKISEITVKKSDIFDDKIHEIVDVTVCESTEDIDNKIVKVYNNCFVYYNENDEEHETLLLAKVLIEKKQEKK